jgi:hypothetical protein
VTAGEIGDQPRNKHFGRAVHYQQFEHFPFRYFLLFHGLQISVRRLV